MKISIVSTIKDWKIKWIKINYRALIIGEQWNFLNGEFPSAEA